MLRPYSIHIAKFLETSNIVSLIAYDKIILNVHNYFGRQVGFVSLNIIISWRV